MKGLYWLGGLFFVFSLIWSLFGRPSLAEERADWSRFFRQFKVDGCFVLYDQTADTWFRYQPARCQEGFLPASTFKIMNALIALETGVARDENEPIPWDGVKRPIAAWNKDHTLKSAFQSSAVWYYEELAARIGRDRILEHVRKVGYGNMDVSGGSTFWLKDRLRITPDEQVEFLTRLYRGDLPFRGRSMDLVKDMMLLEDRDGVRLRGKTGLTVQDGRTIGWFVGWAEKKDCVRVFALDIESAKPDEYFIPARREIARMILDTLN